MENNNKCGIDLYLFFDLLQVSEQIINITKKDSIYILIGDTPSYLKPYFKFKNKTVFNFSASSKPYGCACNPADPENLINSVEYDEVTIPTIEQVNNYFNYLDTKTKLTKKYVEKNWNKIVLIDSSSGMSICGISIFFNKYVGNIDIEKKCKNYEDAKPLLFIRLGIGANTNIKPSIIKNYYEKNNINYDPKLIILLGTIHFFYKNQFMINEIYHRYVPEYSVDRWNSDPEKYISKKEYDMAKQNLKNISRLLELLLVYKTNLDHSREILNLLNTMNFTETHTTYLKKINDEFSIDKLKNFLEMVYEYVIILKYSNNVFSNAIIQDFNSYVGTIIEKS